MKLGLLRNSFVRCKFYKQSKLRSSGVKLAVVTASSSTCAWARDATEHSSTTGGKGKSREKWRILYFNYLSMVNFNNIPGERWMLSVALSQDSLTPVHASGDGLFLVLANTFCNPFTRIEALICYWFDVTWEVPLHYCFCRSQSHARRKTRYPFVTSLPVELLHQSRVVTFPTLRSLEKDRREAKWRRRIYKLIT
jgi:hypothetical protein